MKKELVEKANEILEEIKDLKKYKEFLKDREYGKVAHFEFIQHYGNSIPDFKRIQIDKRHNGKFIPVLESLISELEKDLEEM